MGIKGYRVDIRTGPFTNTSLAESKSFYGSDPLILRREAHKFADEVFHTIKEASDEGVVPYKTENLLKEGVETFMPLVYCEFIDNSEEADEIIVSGEFIQEMIQSWELETEMYLDCNYDTGGDIYSMDCSKFSQGYITVLKDIYEMWHEECRMPDEEYD